MIYTLTVNPSLDYVMTSDCLNIGEVNRSREDYFIAGGKGINVSRMLKNLNIKSVALGFEAGFTGKELISMLQNEGIENDFLSLNNGLTRINVKIKTNNDTEFNASGPVICTDDKRKLFERLNTLYDGDMLVIAGNVQKSAGDNFYAEICERMDDKNVSVAVDTTGAQLFNTLRYKPFLVKPNNSELEELFGEQNCGMERLCFFAQKLREKGAKNVLVSLGSGGAFLAAENGKIYKANAPEISVKYTVGSGDCAVAGFIYGYIKNGDCTEALRLAVACGSANAASDGFPCKELVENLKDKIIVTEKKI